MAKLVNARHDVYGIVEVPETYLKKWPDQYKPVSDEQVRKVEADEKRAALDKQTVEQLKAELERRELPTDGVKPDLIARLLEA